ncbi:MAG TPA: DUF3189 family protein [Firmicutes bacterium]|nr:DUF3189 family protein [Bacillota bacterium]
MKVVYSCSNRAYPAVAAAALHLGWLGSNPSLAEIAALPYWNPAARAEYGAPVRLGRDEAGNEVFVLGRGPAGPLVERALVSAWLVCGQAPQELVVVTTDPYLNLFTRLGAFLSHRPALATPGRLLVAFGIRRSLPALTRCVAQVKSRTAPGLDLARRNVG